MTTSDKVFVSFIGFIVFGVFCLLGLIAYKSYETDQLALEKGYCQGSLPGQSSKAWVKCQ